MHEARSLRMSARVIEVLNKGRCIGGGGARIKAEGQKGLKAFLKLMDRRPGTTEGGSSDQSRLI